MASKISMYFASQSSFTSCSSLPLAEQIVHGWSRDERMGTQAQVRQVLAASGFPFCIVPLELVSECIVSILHATGFHLVYSTGTLL